MNAVTTAQVLPTGTLVATVRYEDGVNDGDYTVRFNGTAVTSVHKVARYVAPTTIALDQPIRVTKATAVGVYYGIVGVFYEWQEEQNRVVATATPERPLEAQAILTVTVWMNTNLTGREDGTHGWDADEVRGYAKAKLDDALATIEDMVPEGTPAGGVLLTKVGWDVTHAEVDGLGV